MSSTIDNNTIQACCICLCNIQILLDICISGTVTKIAGGSATGCFGDVSTLESVENLPVVAGSYTLNTISINRAFEE